MLGVVPSLGVAAPATARLLQRAADTNRRLRVTGLELITVRATTRTTWLFVRLATNQGLSGLG